MRSLLCGLLVMAGVAVATDVWEMSRVEARSALEKRGTTLNVGKWRIYGNVTNYLQYEASGVLSHLECNSKYKIKDCYMMYLEPTGMLQSTNPPNQKRDGPLDPFFRPSSPPPSLEYDPYNDPFYPVLGKRDTEPVCPGGGGGSTAPISPRQRIEFFTWPEADAGQKFQYTWKSYTVPGIKLGNGASFFHTWQTLSRRACAGGPVVTLDIKSKSVVLIDRPRGCSACRSVPLSKWLGRTIQHTVTVKWGRSGTFAYTAVDVRTGGMLMKYSSKGDQGDLGSMKFGFYRNNVKGMSDARGFVGDYKLKKL